MGLVWLHFLVPSSALQAQALISEIDSGAAGRFESLLIAHVFGNDLSLLSSTSEHTWYLTASLQVIQID